MKSISKLLLFLCLSSTYAEVLKTAFVGTRNVNTLPSQSICNNQHIVNPISSFLVKDRNVKSKKEYGIHNKIIRRNEMLPLFSDASNEISEIENDENVLLKIKLLHINSNENDSNLLQTLEEVRSFLRSFPFAAVLPVQPLQYVPSTNGVNVTFLRKKTKEKGSVDGGIFIDAVGIDEEERMIMVIARRNPEGQTVGKIFSEKIALNALVQRFETDQAKLGVEIISIDQNSA